MKKINTLFLLMVGLVGSAFSQTYYSENFNAGTIPAGFVMWNVDGATTNATLTSSNYGWTSAAWMVRPVAAGQNDYWIGSPSWFTTNVTANRWICTPQFTVPSGSTNVLLQWDGTGYYSAPGNYEVRISTTDSNTTSFTTLVTSISESPGWSTHAVPLPANMIGVPIRLAFRNTTPPNTGYAVAIDNILIYTAPSYDMSVKSVDVYEHNWTGTGQGALVQGYLQTNGFNNVTDFRLNYSINGGPAVSAVITPNPALTPSSFYYYQHPTLANPTTDGTYKIKVWCDNINGNNVDGLHSNDTFTTPNRFFYTKPSGVVKKAIVEEMTGAGCPWCPGGAFTLREMLQSHPELTGVAIHSASINDLNVTPADAMAIADGETVVSAVGSGLPSAMVDRTFFFDQGSLGVGVPAYRVDSGRNGIWAQLGLRREAMATPVNVSLSNKTYDAATGALSVDVNATFLNSLSTGDYRLNLYVIEDSITTTGNGYDQDNGNYSGAQAGSGLEFAGALNTMPSTVINDGHAGDWTQNHVLRWMGGGAWGLANGPIPTTGTTAGQTYSHTFTTTIPSTWRSKFLNLVGIVQEYNSDINLRTILNVTGEVKIASGINEASLGLNKLSVYPNPASTVANVEIDLKQNEMVNISMVNTMGQAVTESNEMNLNAGMHSVKIPVSNLAAGLYFVKITINGQTVAMPLSVEAK